jgi:hypothetical protein
VAGHLLTLIPRLKLSRSARKATCTMPGEAPTAPSGRPRSSAATPTLAMARRAE